MNTLRYGRLLAIRSAPSSPDGTKNTQVKCDCGNVVIKRLHELKVGKIKRCGFKCPYRGIDKMKHYPGTKRKCTKCKKWKECNHFYRRTIERAGNKFTQYRSACKPCYNAGVIKSRNRVKD